MRGFKIKSFLFFIVLTIWPSVSSAYYYPPRNTVLMPVLRPPEKRMGFVIDISFEGSGLTGEASSYYGAGFGGHFSLLARFSPNFAIGLTGGHVFHSMSLEDADINKTIAAGEMRLFIPFAILDIWIGLYAGVGILQESHPAGEYFQEEERTYTGLLIGAGFGFDFWIMRNMTVGFAMKIMDVDLGNKRISSEDTESKTAYDYYGAWIWFSVGISIML